MSIDRVSISNLGIDRPQQTQGTEQVRSSGKDRQVPSSSDSVALSSKAKDIERLGNSVEQSRAERFNKVREALESGKYRISGKDIAQKLIDSNQKMDK